MDKKELLAKNIREFYREGNSALQRNSYNSAASLFFKALAVIADWHILQKKGFIPKSHTERFRILEQNYQEIYKILDKDFPVYQDSYSIGLQKETAEVIRDDLRKIAKKVGFELDKEE
ncbi:hypothetical protein HYU07_02100 [Candidatus Woesearchaeota archaeon]|nr:hypothetical protein [Candidatus Woesearchaeota archaeon]